MTSSQRRNNELPQSSPYGDASSLEREPFGTVTMPPSPGQVSPQNDGGSSPTTKTSRSITAPGFPYALCLFSIRRQLMKPYMSFRKNITKQATIGTLEMSEIAAITHSTISTRSLDA